MLVRFLKNPPAAPADTFISVREGRPDWSCDLPRAGVLPVLAARYVIESTLDWNDGWFGTLAATGQPDATTPQARQAEALARLLQAEQWGGATTPSTFRAKLATALATTGLPAPDLSDDQLATLRTELRAFGAIWRPLTAGQSHETTW